MRSVKIKDSDFFNYSNDDFLMLTSKNVLSNNGINEIISKINFETKNYALLEQIHSNKIIFAKDSGNKGRADGLITHIENNLILCIMTADCFPIFIYDSKTGKLILNVDYLSHVERILSLRYIFIGFQCPP